MTEHAFKTSFIMVTKFSPTLSHRGATALTKYIWELKGTHFFNIHSSIIKHAKVYNGSTKWYNLCMTEKLCILSAPKGILLS